MSSISGLPPTVHAPVVNQLKPPVVKPEPASPPVLPVSKDSDGDNDGSKGGKIDILALYLVA